MRGSLQGKTVLLRRQGWEGRIWLNRPRAQNRVNRAMVEELSQLAEQINQDDAIRVVTLTGRGSTFSSGWERLRVGSAQELARYQAARLIAGIQKPVLAAINGDAIGQGLELALAADLRIAVSTARLGLPQVRLGVMPWDGGTQLLPRIVGTPHALMLLFTGAMLDAAEAHRIGLVNRLAEPEHFEETVGQIVDQIASAAPLASRYAKEAIKKGMDGTVEQGLRMEADLNILLHTTSDRAEGIRSFLERRPPSFRGE